MKVDRRMCAVLVLTMILLLSLQKGFCTVHAVRSPSVLVPPE